MEPALTKFLSELGVAGAFGVFAFLLWKRTDKTLSFYETAFRDFLGRIAQVLDGIDERTAKCPRTGKEPPS